MGTILITERRSRQTLGVASVVLMVGLLAVGCASSSGAQNGNGEVSVVANFYPVYEAATMIGGCPVEVANLTPAGAEPHDLELSPKQVDEILDADVLLYFGEGFQPAVQDAVRGRREGVTVDLLSAVRSELRPAPPGSEETGTDPHVWLDPVLMGKLVDAVRDALVRADPAGRQGYDSRAARYRGQIEALDGKFRTGLSHCVRRVIVTSHAAFGYLAGEYGLEQEAISGISPEAEPDPRRLAELTDLVEAKGVTTIFTEELVSPRVADALANEAGVKTAVLSPLEGLSSDEQARGDTYVTVMERNLAEFRAALGCG
jgi:zinc transport system substrate-binding protein